jgi:hypothetical protein
MSLAMRPCKVCFYSSTSSPSTSTVLGCVSPGTAIPTAGAPVLLRLDDGTSCASY